MDSKLSRKLSAAASVVLLATVGISYYQHQMQSKINTEYLERSNALDRKEAELANLDSNESKRMLKENNTPTGKQLKQSELAVQNGQEFFKALYNINSSNSDKDWSDRTKKLKQYATEQGIKTTALDYDSQGINRAYDLKIKFKKAIINTGITNANNQLEGMAQVTYIQDSNLQNSKQRITMVYQFVYDVTNNMFDVVKPVDQLKAQNI